MKYIHKALIILLQLILIIVITYIGNIIQKVLHIPIASSIVGLILFFLLLQFKIIPVRLVEDAASFLLSTMIFFFVPSVVGAMNIGSSINIKFVAFIIVIVVGTCCIALVSGYIAEKMIAKTDDGDENKWYSWKQY